MASILDNIRNIWRKKDNKPVVPPEPVKPAPTVIDKLRAVALLREIPFEKLLPLFVGVPAIVFFAISGVLAWLMLTLKFMFGIFNL
jgi:hypothetical protein